MTCVSCCRVWFAGPCIASVWILANKRTTNELKFFFVLHFTIFIWLCYIVRQRRKFWSLWSSLNARLLKVLLVRRRRAIVDLRTMFLFVLSHGSRVVLAALCNSKSTRTASRISASVATIATTPTAKTLASVKCVVVCAQHRSLMIFFLIDCPSALCCRAVASASQRTTCARSQARKVAKVIKVSSARAASKVSLELSLSLSLSLSLLAH